MRCNPHLSKGPSIRRRRQARAAGHEQGLLAQPHRLVGSGGAGQPEPEFGWIGGRAVGTEPATGFIQLDRLSADHRGLRMDLQPFDYGRRVISGVEIVAVSPEDPGSEAQGGHDLKRCTDPGRLGLVPAAGSAGDCCRSREPRVVARKTGHSERAKGIIQLNKGWPV